MLCHSVLMLEAPTACRGVRGDLCMEGLGWTVDGNDHGVRPEVGAFLCSRWSCLAAGAGCVTVGIHLPSLGTHLLFGKMTIMICILEGWVR